MTSDPDAPPCSAPPFRVTQPIGAGPYLTLTPKPGMVRYITINDFIAADIEAVIQPLAQFGPDVLIKIPYESYRRRNEPYNYECELNFGEIALLTENVGWADKLRIFHGMADTFVRFRMPSWVYYCFHRQLALVDFAFDQAVESWESETLGNRDLAESFLGSSGHLVVKYGASALPKYAVFRLTDFVRERLQILAERHEREVRAAEQTHQETIARAAAAALAKSEFDSFVYLMEDLRNGLFKIGRSRVPAKRERTLQSEQPSLKLRVSVPASEREETSLHQRFRSKRKRGEWFLLDPSDLVWIVSFLKQHGDADRATIDFAWFGEIAFAVSQTPLT
jgi:hypothetical protein